MAQEAAVPLSTVKEVARQIAREEVAKFARSGFLRNASITGGAGLTIRDGGGLTVDDGGDVVMQGGGELTVKDGGRFRATYPGDAGGRDCVYVGDIVNADTREYIGTGLLVQGPDGTDLMEVRTDAFFGTTMHNIYDSAGRIIFGNDAASGQGLARPYIPGVLYPVRYADMTVSSTASSWETVLYGEMPKQLPRLEVGVRATMDTSGATGQMQVLVNGVPMSTVYDIGFAIAPLIFGPEPVAGEHMQKLVIEVQVRRTSATGAVRVAGIYMQGRQSP